MRDEIKHLNLDWIPIFHEISLKLLEYKNDRKKLVEAVYDSFASSTLRVPMDEFKYKQKSKLKDICPFTFIGLVNRPSKNEHRDQLLYKFADFLNLKVKYKNFNFSEPINNADDAIPLLPHTNAWFFAYEYKRKQGDIDKLWNVFEEAIIYADKSNSDKDAFVNAYNLALDVKQTSNANLSMGLYWIRPFTFPTMEKNTQKYYTHLVNNGEMTQPLLTSFNYKSRYSGSQYLEVIDALKANFNNSYDGDNVFINLSNKAYLHVKNRKIISNSKYSGKSIYKLVEENPRQKKTWGHRGFELYYDGMTYEEFRKKEGRNRDLKYDLDHNFIELRDQFSSNSDNKYINHKKQIAGNMKHPLNQILYGPPGTGKTYTTKRLAVAIITGQSIDKLNNDEVLDKYKRLSQDGKISFVTFHQSYGYEEFVEGIRPVLHDDEEYNASDDGGDISYCIQNGIFKELCERAGQKISMDGYNVASKTSIEKNYDRQGNVWQVKLGEGGEFNDDCFKNNYIRRGSYHFHEEDLKNKDYDFFQKKKDEVTYKKRDVDMNKAFCLDMQTNELVVVYKSPSTICAIGVLTNEGYKLLENVDYNYAHSRSIKWLWIQDPNEHSIDILDIKGNGLDRRRSISRAHGISPNVLLDKLRKHIELSKKERYFQLPESEEGEKQNNYVLIIDEINRGNISKILGELITLLEKDKRQGNKEELGVTLPYSRDTFSVPNNLYIIGTMNTADRSIAFLDTALRRRFKFQEVMPKPELLSTDMNGINISKLLESINNKISYHLDRDHQIGHSYFMGDKADTMSKLADTFRNNICPLLDEYFYDRREVVPKILKQSKLIKGGDKSWEWAEDSVFMDKQSYIGIYQNEI